MPEKTSSIKVLRRRRGVTLAELASAIGIDPVHLELIEEGSEEAAPTVEEMSALAGVLGVKPEELH